MVVLPMKKGQEEQEQAVQPEGKGGQEEQEQEQAVQLEGKGGQEEQEPAHQGERQNGPAVGGRGTTAWVYI